MAKLTGTYPAIVTPMQRDGNRMNHAINYDVLFEYLDFLAKGGVNGFVVAGCTGASRTFVDNSERIEFIRRSKEIAAELEGRYDRPLPIIAGDGVDGTYHTVELAKRVEGETGVKLHLMISPAIAKPTQYGIRKHFEAVAEGIEGRIILYSVNGRTGGEGIRPETAIQLASHYPDQFIAIKEASAGGENLPRAREVIEDVEERGLDFTVLSGEDSATYQMIGYGGTGVISVTANVAPGLVSGMVDATLNANAAEGNEREAARRKAMMYNGGLDAISRVLFTENNPQDVMYALSVLGIDVGVPRLPLTEPSQEAQRNIERVIAELELTE